MNNNLKFLVIYRIETQKLISYYSLGKEDDEQLKNESTKICVQIKSINLHEGERQKIQTSNGNWFCNVDSAGLAYLILGKTDYPERHAYALINELREELKQKLGNLQSLDDSVLKLNIKAPLKTYGTKYNDLASLDKIYLAQQNVDETKIVMENNIKNMLVNKDNLDELDVKSMKLKEGAQAFSKNATELASIMYWRNMKLKIIIGLIILAGLLYIIVPIIIKVSASN